MSRRTYQNVAVLGMNLARNTFAGLLTLGTWAVVGVWVARTQGVETWGVLSLFATAQVLATGFEFGLSLYVTRRIARRAGKWPVRMLGAAEALALAQAAGMVVIGVVLVVSDAGRGLEARTLGADLLTRSLGWLALGVACAWPATFYRGVLAGLGSQASFARSLAYFGAARVAVVIPALAFSGSLDCAFGLMCAVGLIESIVSRRLAVARTAPFSFRLASPAGMQRLFKRNLKVGTSASLVGLNSSLDKFVVASVVDLRTLAIYNSAWMVCLAALWTLQPVAQSFYPRICQTVHDRTALWRTNLLLNATIALILLPASLVALSGASILAPVWFEDVQSRSIFCYFAAVMIVGVAINSQTILSWYVGLASDDTRRNLHVGLLSAAFTAFAFPWLVRHVGLVAAPASWLLINALSLLYPGVALASRLHRVGTSLLISAGIIGAVAIAALLLLSSPLEAFRAGL